MRAVTKWVRATTVAASVGALLLMAGTSLQVAYAANTAPQLHVSGNHLVNASGQTLVLHGVNRSGGEFACVQVPAGIWNGPMDQASIDAMKTWNINIVRVPLNEACWNAESYVPAADAGATYQAAVVAYVNLLNSNGIVADLDLHWTDGVYTGSSSACTSAQAICQKPMPDTAQAVPFWTSVANTFKGNNAVIFDLFNEPYPERATGAEASGWTCWKTGGTCSGIGYSVAGMQTLVNAVRGTGATNVISLGGLAYSNDLTAWLANKPTDSSNNLVASWHSYNFNTCSSQSCWTSQIAPVAASVPLITGELGENDCSTSYINPLTTWLDSVGSTYMAWTWNNWDCSTGPSLISDYTGTATAYGAGYKAHLLALGGPTPSPTLPSTSPSASPSATPPQTASPTPPQTASPTPPSTITPPPTGGTGTCAATWHVDNSWTGGFQATVTVTAGSSAITGWTVNWTWPSGQSITNFWNATITSSGSAVTTKNASYNGALGAGGSTTFGMQLNGSAVTPALSCTAAGGPTPPPATATPPRTASPTPPVTASPTPPRTASPTPPVTASPTPPRTASPTPPATATPPPTNSPTPPRTASPTPPRTASPTPPATGGSKTCSASWHIDNSWTGGFQSTVTVTAGSSAITAWTVTWTWPSGQTMVNFWNAGVTTSGSSVTVKNLSYNGSLGAGGNTTFGMQLNGSSATPTLTCSAT